jgi:hypothetical protein
LKTTIKLIALLSTVLFYDCQNNSKTELLEEKIVSKEILRSELDTFYLGGKLVEVEKTDKSDFDHLSTVAIDTSEIEHLRIDADFVKRTRDTLIIKTKAKEVKLITNNNEEGDVDNYVDYRYYGYLKTIDKFLVYALLYESYCYVLVDNTTGDITDIWGIPVISPNGQYFVTTNKDLLAHYTDNGIQLYKNGAVPKLLGERLLDKWGSEDIKWVNNKILVLKASVFDTLAENMEHTEYFRLKLKEWNGI